LLILGAAAFFLITFILHCTSIIIATARCRANRRYEIPPLDAPAVSLVRPVCGTENYCEETLRSTFDLDYPRYEILFCAAHAHDPILPLIERLVAAHPQVHARILVGDDRVSGNPKLNNVVKGWRAASAPWIVIADSNVLMPRDYIQRLLSTWRRASGWHSSVRTPLVWMLRDLLLPALWMQAWLGSTFVWRGNHMHVARPQPVG